MLPKLYKVSANIIYFAEDPFNLKVERIQKEVAKAGMSESFYESGPQSVSQIVISLCTGHNNASALD